MVWTDDVEPDESVWGTGPVRNSSSSLSFSLSSFQLRTVEELSALADWLMCLLIMRLCSFDLCEDTGAAAQFFPSGHTALTGTYSEVSCSEWSGSDGSSLWNGACLSGESAAMWPSGTGCGNQGECTALSTSMSGFGGGRGERGGRTLTFLWDYD